MSSQNHIKVLIKESTLFRKCPLTFFAKEGLYSSLRKREVRRDL